MSIRLAERLSAERAHRFVGRAAEKSLFETALKTDMLPFHLLFVHGPGGIGKTSLLRQFAARCRRAGVPVLALDARNLEATPAAFAEAVAQAAHRSPEADIFSLLDASERTVLLVDTYELLTPLDGWLRDVFLPELPDSVVVVLAGRQPPAPGWLEDAGWQALLRVLPLRNLSPDESRDFLEGRQIPPERHPAILTFTHGHPLALSLVADVFDLRPLHDFDPEHAPDVIQRLLPRFMQKAPGPAHRAALETCALLRATTESLLADILGFPEAHDLFDWLRSLSFVEAGPLGLFPHDLARDALSADLRWRNPDWYAELHRRARAYYNRRLEETHGQEQQRVLSDFMFLHRDNPIIKPFIDWAETGSAVPDAPGEADWPLLEAMVARHEGPASAKLAAYWFARQPERVLVCRGAGQEPIGFLMMLGLQDATETDRRTDEAVARACRHLESLPALRPGECATYFRFWMASDDYQSVSSTQSLLFLKMAQHYLTTPGLAFTFLPCADVGFWKPFWDYIDLHPLPEADFAVGEQRHSVFGHNWRRVPPTAWLSLLAERETATTTELEHPPTAALVVLSEDGFREAVRDALRGYDRPDRLRGNPLLRARVVATVAGLEAGTEEQVEALRGLLDEAAATLKASAREERLYHVLYRTYLNPASSQERAAEQLGLPFSTYRRYLKAAIGRVAELLWQRELD